MSSIFCDNCGSKLISNKKFCSKCGQQVLNTAINDNHDYSDENSPSYTNLGYPDQPVTPSIAGDQLLGKQNVINGSISMLKSPSKNALYFVGFSGAPSTLILVLLRAVVLGVAQYFTVVNDDYYNFLYKNNVDQQVVSSGLNAELIRETLKISVPVITGIFVFVAWFVGSWILSSFIKSDLHVQSPLQHDTFAAMRKLNGYRSIPITVTHFISIFLIFSFPPSIYFSYIFFIFLIGAAISAFMIIKSLGENVGLFGSRDKIAAIATFIFLFRFRI